MTTITTAFEFRPAKRQAIGLLIGLAGSTGSGKTFSALRLATGLARGERFAVIDTENGRALHYADRFEFDHGLLQPPFRPSAYLEAITAADAAGYPVIVVDSASHEHAGEGGLLDWHEEILQKRAGDDWKRRETLSMSAWVEPKLAHKSFVNRLLQINAHLILCFRAEEKVEMAKENGKTVIRPKRSSVGLDGWIPICEKNLPYELTISFLMTSDKPGVPLPIKLEEQHRLMLPLDQPISEESGAALADWAAGASVDDGGNDELVAQLLDLADELGAREQTTALVQRNRRQNARQPAQHRDWLERQIHHAEIAVAERREGDAETDVDFSGGGEPDDAST